MPMAMPTKKRLSSQTGVKIDNSIKLKIPKHYGKPLALAAQAVNIADKQMIIYIAMKAPKVLHYA